jgi:murein lipoprotein
MNKYQVLLGTIALSSTLLVGCANTSKIESDVQTLTGKVDQLATEIGSLKDGQSKLAADVADAKAEAARANARLDNMATHYKK